LAALYAEVGVCPQNGEISSKSPQLVAARPTHDTGDQDEVLSDILIASGFKKLFS
jgi:hypothetical protein